jgi:ketosteroid isomerase-like protein
MVSTSDVRSHLASINQQFAKAFKEGDAAALANFYTADALVLPPNAELVRGVDATQGLWAEILKLGVAEVRLDTVDVEEHGDLAIEVGRATLFASGGGVVDEGKYLVVWKKDAGTWKMYRDVWNSSRPAPA